MTRKWFPVVVAGWIALAVGCDSATPTSPTAVPAAAQPTYVVSGVVSRVVDGGVVPVEGAKVELVSDCQPGRCPRFSLTDREGRFRLNDVPAGAADIMASKFGYATVRATVMVAAETAHDFSMVRNDSFTLSGVVWELTPAGLAGVERVWVYCDSCGEVGHTATYTDADGFYSFQDVHAGVFPILVHKDGYSAVNPVRVLSNYAAEFTARVTGDASLDVQLARQ